MPARFRDLLCTAFFCASLLTAAGTAHAASAGPTAGAPDPGTSVADRPEGDNGWW